MTENMTIISFNCRSIYTKLQEIKNYLYEPHPHCVCFTETWIVDGRLPNFINYTALWQPRRNGRGGGLGILLRSDIISYPSQLNHQDNELEVQMATIQLKNYRLNLMNM